MNGDSTTKPNSKGSSSCQEEAKANRLNGLDEDIHPSLSSSSLMEMEGLVSGVTETTYLPEVILELGGGGERERGISLVQHQDDEMEIPADDDPDLYDPACDPEKPRAISFEDVSAAAFRIKKGMPLIPCDYSHNFSRLTGIQIYFKKEFQQRTGSFKERGARYTLMSLSPEQKQAGVIAASAGNHALALAYHGNDLGIPVVVIMPIIAPLMKINLCSQYGATVIIKGADIGESRKLALKIAKRKNLLYINGYDHPHILAGAGTMGLEIVEQVPDVDAVVIPVGGGGLIAGSALAIKALYPKVQIYGVESERCASFTESMKNGKLTFTKAESTLADGLAVPMPGVNAFASARKVVDKMITISEQTVALTILRLIEMEKAVVEGAGATALAAVLEGKLDQLKGKKVVIPLCGGNIDTTVLGRVIERGLAVDGRLVRFLVVVNDRPGGIAELATLLAGLGVSIKDIFHERAWLKSDIFKVHVKCIGETRDAEHAQELHNKLKEVYEHVAWGPHDTPY